MLQNECVAAIRKFCFIMKPNVSIEIDVHTNNHLRFFYDKIVALVRLFSNSYVLRATK